MSFEKPLAAQLRELWGRVDTKEITAEAATAEQRRLLDVYRRIWTEALLLSGESDLVHSTLSELAHRQNGSDLNAVQRRCEDAVQRLKHAWNEQVQTADTPMSSASTTEPSPSSTSSCGGTRLRKMTPRSLM
jgi:hypothetical protein